MKTRSHDDNDRSPVPAPLSSDLELRPRGTSPASLEQALGESPVAWVGNVIQEINRLHELADQAQAAGDLKEKLKYTSKACDLELRLLKLCLDAEGLEGKAGGTGQARPAAQPRGTRGPGDRDGRDRRGTGQGGRGGGQTAGGARAGHPSACGDDRRGIPDAPGTVPRRVR